MTSPLVEHYRLLNTQAGHALSCAYGAGADCTCRDRSFEATVIKVLVAGEWWPVECERDPEMATRRAEPWICGGHVIARSTLATHEDSPEYLDLRDTCQLCRDRLDELKDG